MTYRVRLIFREADPNMHDLSGDEWKRVYRAVRDVSQVSGVDDFHRHSIDAVEALLPHTVVSSELHNLAALEVVSSAQTREDDHFMSMMPAFAAHLDEHPCVEAAMGTRSLNVMGVRDRMSIREFEGLGLYNEFYRHVDIHDQIIVARSQGFPALFAVAISRDVDFSPQERAMLELFAPALADAHDNWLAIQQARGTHAWATHLLDHFRCGGICLAPDGAVLDHNDLADQLIKRFFGVPRLGMRLPAELAAWFTRSRADDATRRPPHVRADGQGRVEFRLLDVGDGHWVIHCRETPRDLDLQPLLDLGLTPALAEVLRCCCGGLTYRQIGERLGKSPRTVGKQMEQVIRRLDVRDKAEAVAKATRAVSRPLG